MARSFAFEGIEQLESRTLLAGVTLMTHGYQMFGDFPNWLTPMGDAISARVGTSEVTRGTYRLASDGSPLSLEYTVGKPQIMFRASSKSELVVELDWAVASNNFLDKNVPSTQVAIAAFAALVAQDELGNDGSFGMAQYPIHLIGHSRGASAMHEVARLLNAIGIWVDQVTYLDPHPSTSGFNDPALTPVPPNVIFAQNYWQDTFNGLPDDGEPILGARNTKLDFLSHSGIYKYYLGSIDLNDTTFASQSWYGRSDSEPRNATGWAFSRLGGLTRPSDGVGAAFGGAASRNGTSRFVSGLADNTMWPNVAGMQVSRPNLTIGQSLDFSYYYGDRDSSSVVQFFLDSDENPLNGLGTTMVSRTWGSVDVASAAESLSTAGVNPGTYRLGAKITDGSHTRYAYAPTAISLAAAPEFTNRIFFPEGFRSSSVNEYVPMVNTNDFPVTYELWARYDRGDRDQLVSQGTIGANSRGGATITERSKPNVDRVRKNTPYALELRSSAPIGAMLSHYDFDVATGEAFRNDVSQTWFFPSVTKNAATVRDYVTLYNPTEQTVNLTWTVFSESGQVFTRKATVGALRRGGISFQDSTWVPAGRLSVKLTSDVPIIAALSHYEILTGQGFMSLGESSDWSTGGVVPLADFDPSVPTMLGLVSTGPGESDATISIENASGAVVNAQTLRLSSNRGASINLSSMIPNAGSYVVKINGAPGIVSAAWSNDTPRGDGLGFGTLARSGYRWAFADAFMTVAGAGTRHREFISIVNRESATTNVTVRYLFPFGQIRSFSRVLGPGQSATIAIHEDAQVLDFARARTQQNAFFSVDIQADRRISVAMTHWDLDNLGGWTTGGTPLNTPVMV